MIGFGFSSANAELTRTPIDSIGFTEAPSSPVAIRNHDDYVCTTHNSWYSYVSTSSSLSYAKRDILMACMRDGGGSSECHHNLYCSGGPSTPQPSPTPQPNPSPTPAPQPETSYYDWGANSAGFGFCFQYDRNHKIMNGGKGQPYANCESVNPSYYDWGQYEGYSAIHCFQWTPYDHVLNNGRTVPNRLCHN